MLAALAFLVLALDAARLETPTVDEFAHLPAGLAALTQERFDIYRENPPLARALMALPALAAGARVPPAPPLGDARDGWEAWDYGHAFMLANPERYLELFTAARAVVIALALGAALALFLWARALHGERAAAIVTSLFLLSPTLLAHAHLATTDVASTLAILACMLALRGMDRGRPALRRGVLGLALGAALLVKFTAVLLLPPLLLLLALRRGRDWRRTLTDWGVVVGVALVVINVGMRFDGSFARLDAHGFDSGLVRGVQRVLPGWLPVPLPRDYLRGFDAQQRDAEVGEFPSYLMGRWSEEGWWIYNPVALGVKTPEPFLPLLAFGFALLVARRVRLERSDLLDLVVPLGTLFLALTFFNQLDIGIRYLLPLFPFLWLVIGSVWHGAGGRLRSTLGLAVVGYYAATALWIHPGYIGYFNPTSGGPAQGHRWLADSNLDWGQDLYRVAPALEERGHTGPIALLYFGHVHPWAYGIDYALLPDEPVQAVIAASANFLLGARYVASEPSGGRVSVGPDHAAWLRDLEPVARLGSIWLFDTRDLSHDVAP